MLFLFAFLLLLLLTLTLAVLVNETHIYSFLSMSECCAHVVRDGGESQTPVSNATQSPSWSPSAVAGSAVSGAAPSQRHHITEQWAALS